MKSISNSMILLIFLFTLGTSTTSLAVDCSRLISEPAVNHIVLVLDRSYSMKGKPLANAKIAAKAFIDEMKATDYASIIAFGSKVEVLHTMTNRKALLHQSIESIKPEGATVLYDAIAQATGLLASQQGARIVVYLTDGQDTASRYSIRDLEKMNISEGIFVYGIGLGHVDEETLKRLSDITGGTFDYTRRSDGLKALYLRVLNEYYQQYGSRSRETGALTIRSIPDGRAVLLNGQQVGTTPLKLDAQKPGDYHVVVVYERGRWECEGTVKPGYRTQFEARESDLGAKLLLVSRPQGATVFIDDTYVGITRIGKPMSLKDPLWAEKAKQSSNQLCVEQLPPGTYRLRVRALPDFDLGPEQELEVEIAVNNQDLILFVDIFDRKVSDQRGRELTGKPIDPFEALENAVKYKEE